MNRQDALTGAIVADAAALGLHWLYDHARLNEIAQQGPVMFREPSASDFKDVPGYFAHEGKKAGDSSQYGVAAQLASKHTKPDGGYDLLGHQTGYLRVFGPGGSYVGYADRVILGTVTRLLTEKGDNDVYPPQSGVDDDQHPCLAAVPALFAAGCKPVAVDAAVAMTNVNEHAAAAAQAVFVALSSLADGKPISEALAAGAAASGEKLSPLLAEAAGLQPYDAQAAASKYGMPCHVHQGLPVAWHIVAGVDSFAAACEANVMAGGDSCGRALAVGALAGLMHGVPDDLVAKVASLA